MIAQRLSQITTVAVILGSVSQGSAQSLANIQQQLNVLQTPLVLTPQFAAPGGTSGGEGEGWSYRSTTSTSAKVDACADPETILDYLLRSKDVPKTIPMTAQTEIKKLKTDLNNLEKLPKGSTLRKKAADSTLKALFAFLERNGIRRPEEWPPSAAKARINLAFPIGFCKNQQPTTVKFNFPFNPTYESNVLKTDQNINADNSLGFGGTVQVVMPGARPYDLIGLSVQSASSRYDKFVSKDLEAVMIQGAYQFFISASGYNTISKNTVPNITSGTIDNHDMPAQNLIAVETVTLGFQNQTAYTPPFHLEKVDLFTPQVTYGYQNISLAPLVGGIERNICEAASPDYRKYGFCYYLNLALTAGQTYSDLPAQENANVAVSATVGKRFNQSDWKLEIQTMFTERSYESVPGGRNDTLLQIGPNLTYAPPPFNSSMGDIAASFSLPATYYENSSTIAKDTWRGVIAMPTLTLAFQPVAGLN